MTEQQMIIKAEQDGFSSFEIPANDNARWYMMIMYDRGIGRALEGVLDFYASGINFKAAFTNGRPFLDFVKKSLQSDDQLINTKDTFGERLYYFEQISCIRRLLNECEHTHTGFSSVDLIKIPNDISEIQTIQLMSEATNHKVDMRTVKKMFSIINGLWDALFYNHTYTYRYLTALCSVSEFADTKDSRRTFIRILNRASLEW